MTESAHEINPWYESLITALAVGGFLIILGAVFSLTPGIPQKTISFFSDFTTQSSPFAAGTIVLPVPAHPSAHMDFYGALINFMIGIAVLQVVILALRLWAHSYLGRIAETVGNLVFWAGGAVVANVYLLSGTLTGWFTFWASLIIIVGVSLIVRGIIHYSRSWRRNAQSSYQKRRVF
jgi:hypothetical protein